MIDFESGWCRGIGGSRWRSINFEVVATGHKPVTCHHNPRSPQGYYPLASSPLDFDFALVDQPQTWFSTIW